jgi:hypothetical protein
MKIKYLSGYPGDTATFIKDDGLYMCELTCYQKNEWYINAMTGHWCLSDDGLELAEGELISTTATVIGEDD